jgi:hypothetical protein
VLEAVSHIEPVAELLDIALVQALVRTPLLARVVAVSQQRTVVWPALATVPAVLVLAVQPHYCKFVRMAGEKELVAAQKYINATRMALYGHYLNARSRSGILTKVKMCTSVWNNLCSKCIPCHFEYRSHSLVFIYGKN